MKDNAPPVSISIPSPTVEQLSAVYSSPKEQGQSKILTLHVSSHKWRYDDKLNIPFVWCVLKNQNNKNRF